MEMPWLMSLGRHWALDVSCRCDDAMMPWPNKKIHHYITIIIIIIAGCNVRCIWNYERTEAERRNAIRFYYYWLAIEIEFEHAGIRSVIRSIGSLTLSGTNIGYRRPLSIVWLAVACPRFDPAYNPILGRQTELLFRSYFYRRLHRAREQHAPLLCGCVSLISTRIPFVRSFFSSLLSVLFVIRSRRNIIRVAAQLMLPKLNYDQ